jgi:endonuclease/exonuclease/phosphatase family metal-dependent hydrolase
MKKIIIVSLLLMHGFGMQAQFDDLAFGTDSTLEVITWNIEHFPKNGDITIDYVAQIVEAMNVDVVAIQEVTGSGYLDQLIAKLDGWDGFYAYNQYASLCFIYNAEVISDVNIFEIYTSQTREFPRSPLVMEMNFRGGGFVIINNHFKCCGNGELDFNDDWDEEKRRFDASVLLDGYIEEHYPNEKVIVVGDLNDELVDPVEDNVFSIFKEQPANYLITDMDIALGSSNHWSYPSWPSHLDHIFITNELVEEYLKYGSDIRTIRVDDSFGSWYDYDQNVSDHRPVGLKVKTENHLAVDAEGWNEQNLMNFPNPFRSTTTLNFNSVGLNARLEIFSAAGVLVKELKLKQNQSSAYWDATLLPGGIYYARLIAGNRQVSVRKMILLK